MKKLFISLCIAIFCEKILAQTVGIGPDTTPEASAILDVNGTRGFLPPRMTYSQRTGIASPATGLIIYQTNNNTSPAATAGLYIKDATAWRHLATLDDIAIPSSTSWTVAGADQYNALSGDVGIGTSSPDAKLHVYGSAVKFAGPGGHMLFTNDAFGKKIEFFDGGGVETSSITPSTNLVFSTQGHSAHLSLFGSSGNISTSSGVSLDVDGHGNAKETLVLDDDLPEILFKDGIENQASIKRIGASLHIGNTTATGGLSFRTQDVVKAQLESDGDFGINIPVATEKLHVGGNGLFTGSLQSNGAISSNTELNVNSATGIINFKNAGTDKAFVQLSGENLRIGTFSGNNTGNFVVRTNGGDHLTVDENGLTTMKKLQVNQNLEAVKINGNDPAINFFEANVQKGYIWMIDNDMNLGTSNSAGKISLFSSQVNFQTAQVNIGTSIATPSTYKLGVGGRIICEELKVKLQSSGWPDYVFGKNYKLKPLDELEQYINSNHHLPNIPAAQTVEKEGLEVGEMQRRMMEKIEELTLYVIALKKEIELLKTK